MLNNQKSIVRNCLLIFSIIFIVGCTKSYEPSNYDISQIQIARDTYGVPHIFGVRDADVAYGLAWAHAEDDFETIQKTMLAGKAMLGRTFGKDAAPVDFFVHLLETRELANANYSTALSAEFRALVEAYAHGMNDFALAYPDRVWNKRAFPVLPEDILSAYILSLAQMSGADAAIQQIVEGTIEGNLPPVENVGSNAIAIHSSRTVSGENFLAINSHQPLEGPVAWYEAHLHSEEGWNIMGGLFPGGTTIFHGVNEHLGWAHTVNYPDKLDVYKLELNPENNLQYRFDNEWLDLEEKRIWLKVKMWDFITIPVPRKVWKSVYGPTMQTETGTYSIRTGALLDVRGAEQWYYMNKAKNYNEFNAAMSRMTLTGFNTVYADRYDSIFYVSNALLPKRKPGFNWTGVLNGNTSDNLWTEFHDFDELPQKVNPPSGYLYNTNHTPFGATAMADNLDPAQYPAEMDYKREDNNRSLRFREIMPDTGLLSYEQFKEIKFDKTLPETLAYQTNVEALFALDASEFPEIGNQIEALKSWDKTANADSEGSAIFAFSYYHIRDNTTEQNLDPKRAIDQSEAVNTLKAAKAHFLQHFGNELVSLGTYQNLARNGKSLPVFGIPDVISAMRSELPENGVRKAEQGESYIMMVRFGENGPIIETVSPFGASNQPNSPHHTDQMELFVNQQLKPMTLNKEEVLKNAVRIYKPGKKE